MAIPVAALPAVALIEAAPPAPAAVGQEMGGYVVQLGAFANYANAQGFVVRLANQTPTPGVEARVHHAGGFYRVVVGPYATRDEATRAADQWRDGIGIDATIRSP